MFVEHCQVSLVATTTAGVGAVIGGNVFLLHKGCQKAMLELIKLRHPKWESVLRRTTELGAKLVAAERVGIWLFNHDWSEAVCEDLYRATAQKHEKGSRIPTSRYPRYFQTLRESHSIAAHRAGTDPRTQELAQEYLLPLGISSVLSVPIKPEGEVVGLVCYEHTGFPRRWTRDDRSLASLTADLVALALEALSRKQYQHALEESQERLRRLADNTQDMIAEVSGALRIRYASPSHRTVLGREPEQMVGKSALGLVHPDDRPRVVETLRTARTTGSPAAVQFRGRHADGHYVWLECTGNLLVGPDGRPDGAVLSARDVTDRRRDRERLTATLQTLERSTQGIMEAMARLVELRDPYTAGHQRRVAQLAVAIAREMALPEEQVRGIHLSAHLHDIGKTYVPADILVKPGKLSQIEIAMIRTHSQAGYDILKPIEFPWPVADIVLQHHERLDGSGYPAGRSGDEILLEARIIGVADVVEAMSSYRPYRAAVGLDAALEEIAGNSGIQYDPTVVEACRRVIGEKGFCFTQS